MGHRLAPARPMISFFGVGCETLWEKLAPCVAVERQLRKVDYYLGYFEALAALSEKIGADGLNKKITTKMRLGRVPLK
ncbi:Uncharacterised protein [Amycolatopsis camponoti]|uniref:Uncharacterized protein n=1 Tax=Amycolatopsis camponoti TaxID=2606593 RepID=A0A6I8LM57_9PSEU|nr:Uncharacterised protein [Amycolatopsis camponoti]